MRLKETYNYLRGEQDKFNETCRPYVEHFLKGKIELLKLSSVSIRNLFKTKTLVFDINIAMVPKEKADQNLNNTYYQELLLPKDFESISSDIPTAIVEIAKNFFEDCDVDFKIKEESNAYCKSMTLIIHLLYAS